ncbi:acyl carrier protein [Tardiphaga sp. vice352]|uniref:acyl carrier protein n=1 Tax=Tardiphaga sp. vice352 TaxID=2592816 RepID=UPI001164FBE2|nr:acyl carrier protein [Tardiphaga sp. vice352]QDM33308.1 acyl carrier protein [Tardiphaga sp. vice352]
MNRRFLNVISNVFGVRPSEIRAEMTRAEIGSWDSLKQMDLVMSLEREYDIELQLPDILRMTTIVKILDVLAEKGVDLAD